MSVGTKRCKTCKVEKPITDFSTNGKTNSSRRSIAYRPDCKVCRSETRRAEYAANPEPTKTRNRESYQRHRERARATNKKWRRANYARVREHQREYEGRWRAENLDRARAKTRREQWERRWGRDPEAVAYADILLRDPCVYCGEAGGTVDHIVPLAGGGGNDWTNLAGACLSCNCSKRDKPLLGYLHGR